MALTRNAMIPRLLSAIVLFTSAGAASSSPPAAPRKVQAHGTQTGAAGTKCELTPERAPALYGFRLGMTVAQVAGRFPDFPDLARFESAAGRVEWKDATGARAISRGKGAVGMSALSIDGRYLAQRVPPGERVGEFRALGLLFLDGRLVRILVSGWQSPNWQRVEEFRRWVTRRYAVTPSGWRVFRPVIGPPPGVSPDYLSDTHALDCAGFEVVVSCVVAPASPDFCELIFVDAGADEIIGARIRAMKPE